MPVGWVAYLGVPTADSIGHDDVYYREISRESLDKLALSPTFALIEREIGVRAKLPSGHMLPFKKGVTEEERLAVVNEYDRVANEAAKRQRRNYVARAFVFWLGPCLALYGLGWCIGWVYSGFRET